MFESLFTDAASTTTSAIELIPFMMSVGVALVLGLALALVYRFRSRCTQSFLVTLTVLPAIVAVVIMMVNGNLGAGVAVAGAFSLVRFRSVAGNARDIAFIFLAMAVGLVCGMGYVAYAAIITAVFACVFLALQATGFGSHRGSRDRTLLVTIPEDLDYTGLLADVFARHTTYHDLMSVKSTNMGSLFRLTYNIGLADPSAEKALIDDIRVRNGNLEVALTHPVAASEEL